MKPDDIIRMAEEAGFPICVGFFGEMMGNFANLVAAHERQWVGLTDEDMAELRRSGLHEISDKHFRAVESKLKEKNT